VEIIRLEYDGFDWDAGNVKKAQKHGLSLGEIEDFFEQELFLVDDPRHSKVETRKIAVGLSKKHRPMFIAFTLRTRADSTLIRVISARYGHEKESKAYEKLKKSIEK
jgi:uncharacterized protein